MQQNLDPAAQYTVVDGAQYCYRQAGHRPPIVLLHGLSETSKVFWRELFAHFENEFTVVAVDLKGYGGSEKPAQGYQPAEQARGILGLMDQLGLENPVRLGHSLRGIIAAKLAVLSPSALHKLILYDCPVPGGIWRNLSLTARMPVIGVMLTSLLLVPPVGRLWFKHRTLAMTRFLMRALHLTADPCNYTDEMVQEGMRNSYDAISQGIWSALITENLFRDLDRIRVPTLIIQGEYDALVPRDWIAKVSSQMPNSRLVMIREAGHTALNEQPDQFIQAVSEFLTPQ